MTTLEVAKAAGVCAQTVRNNALILDGRNLRGAHGWEFPSSAPQALLDHLHKKGQPKRNSVTRTLAKKG